MQILILISLAIQEKYVLTLTKLGRLRGTFVYINPKRDFKKKKDEMTVCHARLFHSLSR